MKLTQSTLSTAVAASTLLALLSGVALADRGRGSIRAEDHAAPAAHEESHDSPAPHDEGHAAPAPRAEDHPEARPEEHAAPQPVREEPHAAPDVRHDVPARAPAQRDWDENDEDARHFGGFAPGTPVRVIRGQRVHDLPPAHTHIPFDHHDFFFDNLGAYYELQPDGQYLVVQPPVGIVVAALPSGVTPITLGPTTYYYLDGVFYVPQPGGYAVVNPPPGIVVPTLPSGASQVVVNGTVAYQFNGFNYVPSLQDGTTVYTVTPM